MPIGVAIIGRGKDHALANHLPGLKLHPQAKLVAVCDSNPEAVAHAEKETGATGYTDCYQAIADPEVDAVIVATPNFVHPPAAIAAAHAHKHILCEKPLALNYKDALFHAARRRERECPAHDRIHLSLRPGDALSRAHHATWRPRTNLPLPRAQALPGLAIPQYRLATGEKTGRHRRNGRHAQPPHRLCASPRRPDQGARRRPAQFHPLARRR